MRMFWKVLSLCLVLLLVLPFQVKAHAVPDMTQKGDITVTFKLPAKLSSNGQLTLFRVGDVHEDDGNYSFIPIPELADPELSFADPSDPELPKKVEKLVEENKLTGLTRSITHDGKIGSVRFQDLELGLYLAVQKTPASGYYNISSFLITMPYLDKGIYLYTLTVEAKSELEKEPEEVPPPPPGLPQTGQLNWPVPTLAVLGLCCICAGLILRSRGTRKEFDQQT